MPDHSIPENVRGFIFRHIDSIAQLEALLLLRANPADKWDVAETAKRLYVSEQDAATVLAYLCEESLIECSEGIYYFDKSKVEQRIIVDCVAATYSKNLIAITNMIHAKPRRIRQFSDAFKLRRNT